VVDVFADRPFAGNPLAVVHGAEGLETAQLQALAREFNLSETVFPLPATATAAQAGAGYRARIFTPASELPFAGHPSVGVAWVLGRDGVIELGDTVQECGAGLLPVTVSGTGARVYGGAATLGEELDADALAAAVGLDPADVEAAGTDPGAPAAQSAGAGLEWSFLRVRPDAVARAVLPTSAGLAGHVQGTGLVVVAFDVDTRRAHVRAFGPDQGVPEDPATGSAAVALGVWLVARGLLPPDGDSEVTVAQGAEMGRPSTLELRVVAEAGRAVRTSVGGSVVPVSAGTIAIPPLP